MKSVLRSVCFFCFISTQYSLAAVLVLSQAEGIGLASCCVGPPPQLPLLYVLFFSALVSIASGLMLSSVVLDLRLIGFEAAKSSSCCRWLGNPVAAADAFKLALPDDLHCHPHFSIIGPFCRAAQGRWRRWSGVLHYPTVQQFPTKPFSNPNRYIFSCCWIKIIIEPCLRIKYRADSFDPRTKILQFLKCQYANNKNQNQKTLKIPERGNWVEKNYLRNQRFWTLPELGSFWLHLKQLPHRRAWHIGREFL